MKTSHLSIIAFVVIIAVFLVGRFTAPDSGKLLELELKEARRMRTIDSLQYQADVHQKKGQELEARIQAMADTIAGSQTLANKYKKLYENILRHPVVFHTDAQRDSILSELYGKN